MTEQNRPTRRSFRYLSILLAAVLAATIFGGIYGEHLLGSPLDDELDARLREYTDLLTAASYWSAEPVESDRLVYSSIEGMLRTLDPHTTFLEPRDYSEMQAHQKGSFYGLGILITRRNNQITVITPLEGTPASRLGIRAGDIIADIEGTPTDDMQVDEVARRLKGPKGTQVNIKILRVGIKDPIPMTITREAIPTNSISYVLMVRPGVGYIRIKDFTYTTIREMNEAVETLKKQGMQSLVLDLRMNPGGLLDAAVGVSDFFLPKGEMIVYHKGRTPDSYQEYRAPGREQKLDVPLVILINRESASASEIVTGAIQDHDRGLVVGETSWGKGLVQSVYSLQYGAGLALTTSRYYTPSGRNIQRDYSSFYDYYLGEPGKKEKDESHVYSTDTGRKVYGGGGITPDVVVDPKELPRVMQLLQVRSAFFNFGVRYFAQHPDVSKDLVVTDAIVDQFIDDAVSNEIAAKTDIDAALQDPDNRGYLKQAIKAEIVAAKFGYDASYVYRLQGDRQLEKAIELLPQAARLAELGREARSNAVATRGENQPTGATASHDRME